MSGGKYCGIEKSVGSKKELNLEKLLYFFLVFIFLCSQLNKTYFLTFCPGTRWQGESWGVVAKVSFNP